MINREVRVQVQRVEHRISPVVTLQHHKLEYFEVRVDMQRLNLEIIAQHRMLREVMEVVEHHHLNHQRKREVRRRIKNLVMEVVVHLLNNQTVKMPVLAQKEDKECHQTSREAMEEVVQRKQE